MTGTSGKVVVISGGARGMGAQQARTLIAEGARVVVGDVLIEQGHALARELGGDCLFLPLDVTSPDGWKSVMRTATDTFDRVDGLVNNAGILVEHRVDTASLDDWNRTIAVNQTGILLGMQAVIPCLRDAGGGSIVNISSTGGMTGFTDCFAYVASKWAVRGMTKAAALELARDSIRVNSVHPGDVETDMIAAAISTSGAVTSTDSIPLGRYGTTQDIADLVAFLLGDRSSYLTGAEFIADGGFTAGAFLT